MKKLMIKLISIENAVHISPIPFVVPFTVIILILKKTEPLIAPFIGALMGGILSSFSNLTSWFKYPDRSYGANNLYKGVMNRSGPTKNDDYKPNPEIKWYLLPKEWKECLVPFGWFYVLRFLARMEAMVLLTRISDALLKLFKSVFGLFVSTVMSCVAINVTASISIWPSSYPVKMYKKAHKNKGLHPVNLSLNPWRLGTSHQFCALEYSWSISIRCVGVCNRWLFYLCSFQLAPAQLWHWFLHFSTSN